MIKRYVSTFSFNYNIIDTNNISGIDKYLMIIGLLGLSGSLATKYMSLNREQCKTKPFVIDVNALELEY